MKKIIILLHLVFVLVNLNAQWWNLEFEDIDTIEYVMMYELTFREDTAHLNRYETDKYMLSIGKHNGISSYGGYNSYKGDMEMRKRCSDGTVYEWLQNGGYTLDYVSAHRSNIFKRYNEKKIITIDNIFAMGLYEYEEPFDSFNWQITSETDTIHNYVCQKAICDFGGRTWEAWFTMEIPISDGPYKFCGLPGLILNIADTQDHYSWKFLSIEKPSEPMTIYEIIEEKTPTTKGEFFKLQDRNKISHSIGAATFNNDKAIQKAIEYEKSKNNPIELR